MQDILKQIPGVNAAFQKIASGQLLVSGINLKTAVDRLQSPKKPRGHSISMLR